VYNGAGRLFGRCQGKGEGVRPQFSTFLPRVVCRQRRRAAAVRRADARSGARDGARGMGYGGWLGKDNRDHRDNKDHRDQGVGRGCVPGVPVVVVVLCSRREAPASMGLRGGSRRACVAKRSFATRRREGRWEMTTPKVGQVCRQTRLARWQLERVSGRA